MFGLDDLLGSGFGWLIDAGTSALNAGLDSLGLSQHGRDQYFNRSMMREQMDWQSGEAQKNRDFQTEMYERQLKNYPELLKMQSDSDFNRWKNQFNIESSYNSQGNQVARNLVAGINPASQGSALTQGVSMSPSTSAPPHISPSPVGNPSPVGIPSVGMSRGLLSDIGSFLNDLAQAKKSDKETSRYDEMATAVINKYKSDSALADVQAAAQDIHNSVDKAYLEKETKERINRIVTEAEWFVQRGETEKAEKKLKEAQEVVEKTKNKQLIEQFPIVKENLIKEGKLLDEKRKTEKSQQSKNYSEAKLNNENAQTVKELRPYEVSFAQYKSDTQKYVADSSFWRSLIDKSDYVVSNATKEERISLAIRTAEQTGLVNDKLGYEIQEAMAKGEFAEAKELMGLIESGVSIGTDIGRVRSLDKFATNQEIRNQIDQNYNYWKMSHTETTKTYNGKGKLKSEQHRIYR